MVAERTVDTLVPWQERVICPRHSDAYLHRVWLLKGDHLSRTRSVLVVCTIASEALPLLRLPTQKWHGAQ